MSRLRISPWAAVAVTLAVVMSACSSGPPPERPLTVGESERLSEVLYNNWDNDGASFSLSVRLPSGATVAMDGQVDFVTHTGRAQVWSTGLDAAVTEVLWDDAVVLERNPAFTELAHNFGRGDFDYVARELDGDHYEIDSLLLVILSLGSEIRENPLLIQQNPNSLWLRSDVLRETEVDVFSTGERSRLWLEAGTSTMMRFESNNSVGTRPIVVDLFDRGPVSIAAPDPTVVAEARLLDALYEATGGYLPALDLTSIEEEPTAGE